MNEPQAEHSHDDQAFPFVISRHDGFIHATRDILPGEVFEMSLGEYEWLKYHAKPDKEGN